MHSDAFFSLSGQFTGLPAENKFQDRKIMENRDIFQEKPVFKTCIKQDKYGQKQCKIDKKAYLYVADIGVDLSWKVNRVLPLSSGFPSSPKSGFGGITPRKFGKSRFNLVHSDACFCFSGQFRIFLPFSGQFKKSGISGHLGLSLDGRCRFLFLEHI